MVGTGPAIYSAVKPIFKIYFIIAIGYYLAKRNILSVPTCRDISDAIVTAIMPCLIFNNIVTNLKSSDIKNIGIIFFESSISFGSGVLIAYIIFKITKCPKRWFGGLLSVGLFPNTSDLPIAYLQTLSLGSLIFSETEGDKGVAYVCIFLAAQVLLQFSFGLYRLIEYDFRDELKDDEEKQISAPTPQGSTPQESTPQESVAQESASSQHNTVIDDTAIDDSLSSIDSNTSDSQEESKPEAPVDTNTSNHEAFLRKHEEEGSLRARKGRRNSNASGSYSLNPTVSRAVDLRLLKSQDVEDVINEYSEFERLRNNEVRRAISGTSEVGVESIHELNNEDAASKKTIQSKFGRRIAEILKNLKTPNSISLAVSIIIAMAPPLKALFVESAFSMASAPDQKPPLSFVIDLTSYIGNAAVPLGLLLLGATISRLKVNSIPDGFWLTVICVVLMRLIILPIIGIGVTTGLHYGGWYDDQMLWFVSVLEYSLPNATSLIYFTAFYTDPHLDEHLQMDCLSLCCISQYLILWLTLPIVITFTLKVSMGL